MAVGLSHVVFALLVNVHRAIKLLGPGCYVTIEVRVRDGNGLDATQAVQLFCRFWLQDIDAVPQNVARACSHIAS